MRSSARRRAVPARWEMLSAPGTQELVKNLANELRVSEPCARILVRRGHTGAADAQEFLARRLDALHDPLRLPDMPLACARIAEAVEKNQSVLLFGDYDADGLSATMLLSGFLELLKQRQRSACRIEAFVPERRDGYGLNPAAMQMILQRQPDLLITLDNGITANAQLAALAARGIACIVVDHHLTGGALPGAVAVIDPHRADSDYPFRDLCGAGLAFKLAWALAMHFSQNVRVTADFRAFLVSALALAALGTVADVVPLKGENRILVYHGLRALGCTESPGLRALRENAGITGAPSAGDVAFRIAPRLNAAGRCGQAAEALELLRCGDAARASTLATLLDGYNTQRQSLEKAILLEARGQAADLLAQKPGCRTLVLDGPDWHLGVIGIVAARLVEEYHRPAVLLARNPGGQAQGSGRSISAFHLRDALARHQSLFHTFGGHAAAAGVTLEAAQIPEFKAAFERTAAELLTEHDMLPRLRIDAQLELAQVTTGLCAELERFEPCGAGNPRPTLAVLGAAVPAPPRLMGQDQQHLSFFIKQGQTASRVVGFNRSDQYNALCDLSLSGGVDVAFRPKINTWRGANSVELVLEAFRRSSTDTGEFRNQTDS